MIREKIKALWKLCFDDSEEFIDMYFRLRYNNEVNIAIESGEEVISALQMIPYPMTFCGKVVQTSYISGACTHPDYRGNGAMRELLSQALARMAHSDIAFSTLIPAEPWLFQYYAGMGYASVFRYSERSISRRSIVLLPGVTVKKATGNEKEIYQYFRKKMEERPCCIQHTPADFNVVIADMNINGGALYTAVRGKQITGIAITHPQKTGLQIDELFADSQEIENALLFQIQEDTGSSLTIITPPVAGKEQSLLGMARIINVKPVLQLYAATYPEHEMNIELTDKQLPTNNGYYYLCKGKCMVSKERLPGTHQKLSIRELAERLLNPLDAYMNLMLN